MHSLGLWVLRYPRGTSVIGGVLACLVSLGIFWSISRTTDSQLPLDPALSLFGALLAGESIVFAFIFGASTSWPSLHAVDRQIRFSAWLLIGAAASFVALVGTAVGGHEKLPGDGHEAARRRS